MGIKRWTGAVSGAYATNGNWVGNAAPVVTDDVIIDGASLRAIDGSDQSAAGLNSFTVTANNLFNIGSSGASLQITALHGSIRSGGAELWMDPAIGNVLLAPQTSGPNACQWGGANGSLGRISVAAGNVVLRAGSTWGSPIYVFTEGGGTGSGPFLDIEPGQAFAGSDELVVLGGQVQLEDSLDQALSRVIVAGGILTLDDIGTTVRIDLYGGEIRHMEGTVTVAKVRGGLWDGSRSSKARVITSMVVAGPAPTVDFREGTESTWPVSMVWYGQPTILVDSGFPMSNDIA